MHEHVRAAALVDAVLTAVAAAACVAVVDVAVVPAAVGACERDVDCDSTSVRSCVRRK